MTGDAGTRLRAGVIAAALGLIVALAAAAEAAEIRIAYLSQPTEQPPGLSQLQMPPADEGLAGARLAIDDNATTGRFTGQRFALDERMVAADGDVVAALTELAAAGHRFLVADLSPTALDRVMAQPAAAEMLIFNAGADDDRFRNADCRANLLHTRPSRNMRADALAQYLVVRKWTRWFLVSGDAPGDALYAQAVRRAAKRFGAEIAVEKAWASTHDARRTAQEEVPVFTQAGRYDVLVVADEAGLFGDYFLYRTWDPRPVVGTQGLVATAWHPMQEQWGALQLQTRFIKKAGRRMIERDYAAWVAVRSVGEAAIRARSDDPATITAALRGDDFELAAFKGRKVSFRRWDGQLRQPITLAWERALVSVSPQEGFLHPATDLDTLGDDAPESRCTAHLADGGSAR